MSLRTDHQIRPARIANGPAGPSIHQRAFNMDDVRKALRDANASHFSTSRSISGLIRLAPRRPHHRQVVRLA
jgi:hypothetical protein